MAKYRVSIGEDFALDGVEIEDLDAVERLAAIAERRRVARRRDALANVVLGAIIVALICAGLLGLRDGTFDELSSVWIVAAPWLGIVLLPMLQKGLVKTHGTVRKLGADKTDPDGYAA